MELHEFFSKGIHPFYRFGMDEHEFRTIVEAELLLQDEPFCSIYADHQGNQMSFLLRKLDWVLIECNAGYEVAINGEVIPNRASLGRIRDVFDRNGIEWRFDQRHCFGKQLSILTEGGASLQFRYTGTGTSDDMHISNRNLSRIQSPIEKLGNSPEKTIITKTQQK